MLSSLCLVLNSEAKKARDNKEKGFGKRQCRSFLLSPVAEAVMVSK